MDLELYFGTHLVGTILGAFYSEMNWYGVFLPSNDMPPAVRVFIAFCGDWHVRQEGGQVRPREFDQWKDLLDRGSWSTVAPDGVAKKIQTPFFWDDGELCWRDLRKA
jgi:hypothetical protein